MTRATSTPDGKGGVRLDELGLLHPIATQRHAGVFLARREGRGPGYRFLKLAHDGDRLEHCNRMIELEFERLNRTDSDLFLKPRRLFRVDGRSVVEFPFAEGVSLSEITRRLRKQQPETIGPLAGEATALAVQFRILDAAASVAGDDRPAFLVLATSGTDHLLVTRDGGLRFIGFADVLEGGTPLLSDVWSPFTAPELLVEGRVADQRADIFAAGVLLFQLLTLRPVISDREPSGHLAYRLYRNLHPKVSDVVPELAEFDPLVDGALRWLPEERFQTAEAFKGAILALRPKMGNHPGIHLNEVFRLGVTLRGDKAEPSAGGNGMVGMKLSSVD